MTNDLSTEFKTSFGRMLVGLNMVYTVPNALNYSQTLILFTMGGLTTLGKMGRYSTYKHAKDYDQDFKRAEILYKEALASLRIRGRENLVEEQILAKCYDINKMIFPIALSEGILVLNESMFSALDMFQKPPTPDSNKRSH